MDGVTRFGDFSGFGDFRHLEWSSQLQEVGVELQAVEVDLVTSDSWSELVTSDSRS